MMRRHSWAIKLKRGCKVSKSLNSGARKIIMVDNVKECEHCNLMKGVQKSGGTYMNWHNTIYFDKSGMVLSEEKLPYPCTGVQANFLTKEDFYV